jgi:DNA replication ATP-dependent helicase Dna2
MTLPVCLGPLQHADVFILVGDHYQLPAVVQSPEARDNGFADSLFQILSNMHKNSVSTLRKQYRMNEDIMALSNDLIYDGMLKCADAVQRRKLMLKKKPADDLAAWLKLVVDPEYVHPRNEPPCYTIN